MLINSTNSLGVTLVLDQWLKKTIRVRYFTELISDSFGNGPMNKIRNYMLDILPGLLRDHFVTNYWINQTLCVS